LRGCAVARLRGCAVARLRGCENFFQNFHGKAGANFIQPVLEVKHLSVSKNLCFICVHLWLKMKAKLSRHLRANRKS
jgi:hypothetical protein